MPRGLRRTIIEHKDRLEEFGPLCAARTMVEIGSGAERETTAYYLNEEQALYICALSRTEAGHRRSSGWCIRRVQ